MSKLITILILLIIIKFLCLAESLQEQKINFLDFKDAIDLMDIKPKKQENRSGPSFLMNAYSETVDKVSEVNYTNYQLTPQDLAKIYKSDTVASFVAQQQNRGRGGKSKKVQRMWFDVLIIRNEQRLLKADLRLFRDDSRTVDKFRGQKFNLTVSRVETKADGKKFIYVTSTIIDPDFKGWIILDVTPSFQWWTDNTESNEGFKITTTPLKKSKLTRAIKPELLGIVGFDGDEDKHAFAVGYYKGLGESFFEFQVSSVVKRRTREADIHSYDYEEEYYDFNALNDLDKQLYPYTKSLCKVRKILIRLKDIGLDFIIAPAVIDLNDCIGRCKYPFPADANATDHAIMKIRQSIYGVSRLNKPGCTPIGYQDRTFLYFGSENVLISRKFKNISASACGCR